MQWLQRGGVEVAVVAAAFAEGDVYVESGHEAKEVGGGELKKPPEIALQSKSKKREKTNIDFFIRKKVLIVFISRQKRVISQRFILR
jgi:hypothetical protein